MHWMDGRMDGQIPPGAEQPWPGSTTSYCWILRATTTSETRLVEEDGAYDLVRRRVQEGDPSLPAEDGTHAGEREGEDEVARREDLDDLGALPQERELQLRNFLPGGALRLSGVTLSRERCQEAGVVGNAEGAALRSADMCMCGCRQLASTLIGC